VIDTTVVVTLAKSIEETYPKKLVSKLSGTLTESDGRCVAQSARSSHNRPRDIPFLIPAAFVMPPKESIGGKVPKIQDVE